MGGVKVKIVYHPDGSSSLVFEDSDSLLTYVIYWLMRWFWPRDEEEPIQEVKKKRGKKQTRDHL
jgi:hypothetical protein